MNPLVYWNELAELPPAADHVAGRARMDALVDVLAALQRTVGSGPKFRLRSEGPIDSVVLAEAYPVARWRVDTDRDRRLLLLSLATSSPLLQAEDAVAFCDHYESSECRFAGQVGRGLTAAWAAEELAVSLDSGERWREARLRVEVCRLDEQAEVHTCEAHVRHVAVREHVEHHREWLAERARRSVSDARDLWTRRDELLPHLVFCREVEKQLTAFDSGSAQLRSIVSRLFELDAAFRAWCSRSERAAIHPEFVPTKCSPETPQTLAEEASDHKGTLPDGTVMVFSWHVRFTPGAGRIFFEGDATAGRGIIGRVAVKKDGRLT